MLISGKLLPIMKTPLSESQIITEGPFFLYGIFRDQVWFHEVSEGTNPKIFMYLVSDCLSIGLEGEFLESAPVTTEFFFHYTEIKKEGIRSVTCGLQNKDTTTRHDLIARIKRIQGNKKKIEEKYLPTYISIPYNPFFDKYEEEIKKFLNSP